MTIFDTSVMFGTIDRNGDRLLLSRRAFDRLPRPYFTTEACIAEAMHLAGSRLGWNGQSRVWHLLSTYAVEVLSAHLSLSEFFMSKYRDVPMDFADATIVAFVSVFPQARVATFDSDFTVYRREDNTPVPLVDDRLLGWA